ncbi:DNA-binding protein YbaB [Saccharothrix tamanrassetensis]|uniref:DNA-binding protein YbaB n=1 Tax=Saccharothrix tamanrassetensis TaxID=1051531 RepID=A0A841CH63_9PSEU|nr:YbaB/EbfC family nucleoid-associated protein [Saccharothrix tamanrassetensis]MBB5955036.1 DNA-binding protein YbaB [Saccharothrix tamanrassetensis]
MDPRQWLDDYESRLADLKQKSADLQENVAAANARVTSNDGAVTVTVGPNGGLLNLELGHRACDLGPARLTALIMTTARTAQAQAARKVVEAFAPMGAGTEAMRLVIDATTTAGGEPDADGTTGADDHDPEPEPEPQPPRVQVRPQPVAPPKPVRPARRDDEDDDENQPW